MHKIHMVIDLQFGSTGKGLLAGFLAKREDYDTAVCSFATNAGHTYVDAKRNLHVMTQQLPTAITSPTVKTVLLGPGSLIHPRTLAEELARYAPWMNNKTLLIHPQAAIVEDYHKDLEIEWGMTKMGSTAKGVGAAAIERIRRGIKKPNTAAARLSDPGYFGLGQYVCTVDQYRQAVERSESMIVEGAQGFGLSMYHGFYPYTTSRDVTPWQIAADCGLPFKCASYINIYGTLRTYPIRVNNRDGSSGPGYPDQREMEWSELPGIEPELTTVTKLPRRIFTFSIQQLHDAMWHCGHYWKTHLFLNFANYMSPDDVYWLIHRIERPCVAMPNSPRVEYLGYGPDDKDVMTREQWNAYTPPESEGGSI